ncbi:helix-turn-helix domain-containing protein [Streptomyces sp. ASQP_92]|uniref:helix-turn-helix domain-containing protein n=1 Tax=Streptomyces sp. ASQP_92 TaxID=2979116 RepID=UPI0021C00B0E|nr:helix-turn-helix domain-containing protein [Streptomyces sp. ASQP_92]MCT9093579.1 helix-turn-helix domain-containing protein [Streptomyces sp. ASQP_92]
MTSEFSALLKELRHEANLTQDALAERAGVGVRTIRGLETGERADPRMTTVRLLADALGLNSEGRERLLASAVRRAGNDTPSSAEPTVPADASGPGPAQRAAGVPPVSPWHHVLAGVADEVARTVAGRWRNEEERRQVHDPYPLPVRWRPVAEELTDHWANIRCLPPGSSHQPLDLSGQLDSIVDVYGRIPSGRLVVLGRSGSGKTILAVRFVLDLLKSRGRADPVPVIFSVGSWDPTALTLRDWLAAQLTRDHPGLAVPGPGGTTLAGGLVETGHILPVLDGFDEIAAGLRRPALEALNTTTLPLLLTSRPSEYAAAVEETDVLTSAAAVELTDLTVDDLAAYLPRTTRKSGGRDRSATAWEPVLRELRERRPGPAAANLAAVLTTPLMVTLARAVYSDTPGGDPAALLDTRRFGTPEELEEHLLDNFTTAAYRPRPGDRHTGGPHHTWDPERARYWLGYLAHHLNRLDTPNLEWWRLGHGMSRLARTSVTALIVCLSITVVDGVAGLPFDPLAYQLVDGLVAGPLAGLLFGIAYWFMVASRDTAVEPSVVRMRVRGRQRRSLRHVLRRLLSGALGAVLFGLGYGFVRGALNGIAYDGDIRDVLVGSLTDGIIYSLMFAVATGPTLGLLTLFETSLDIRSAVDPVSLLRTNGRTVVTQLLVWTPVFGLLIGLGSMAMMGPLSALLGPVVWHLTAALKLGVISGLSGALGYMFCLTSWGQWTVFSRIWLPLTGRLPWSVVAFLEDAHRRGVLRQAGAVYQFRHARLQHHLARAYKKAD